MAASYIPDCTNLIGAIWNTSIWNTSTTERPLCYAPGLIKEGTVDVHKVEGGKTRFEEEGMGEFLRIFKYFSPWIFKHPYPFPGCLDIKAVMTEV